MYHNSIESYPKSLDDSGFFAVENLIFNRLATSTYCSNVKSVCFLRSKQEAIWQKYLSINNNFYTNVLAFDLDYECSATAWYENDLPPPNIIVVNPENGHAQLFYILESPIYIGNNASKKIIRYMTAVKNAMSEQLGADMNFANRLTKNPFHKSWHTSIYRIEPYQLGELAECVLPRQTPETAKKIRLDTPLSIEIELGRNCAIFDTIRHWAYIAVNKYDTLTEFHNAVYDATATQNKALEVPLPLSEVRSISKSIANWTWRERKGVFGSQKPLNEYVNGKWEYVGKKHPFKLRQTIKGNLGNMYGNACVLGGKARSATFSEQREQAKILQEQGLNNTQIAKKLGVARTTVIRWLKSD